MRAAGVPPTSPTSRPFSAGQRFCETSPGDEKHLPGGQSPPLAAFVAPKTDSFFSCSLLGQLLATASWTGRTRGSEFTALNGRVTVSVWGEQTHVGHFFLYAELGC